MSQDIKNYLLTKKEYVDKALVNILPQEDELPSGLHQAMIYAVLNGGKRIRPALTFAMGEALGVSKDKLTLIACAIELVHDYSLIHDDLPALDNDDIRRGKPSCHIAFDEATAILAGDALQTLAFETLIKLKDLDMDPRKVLDILAFFSSAIGSRGLIGGESLDLDLEDKPDTAPALVEHMYKMKTAKLIQCCIVLPFMASSMSNDKKKFDTISLSGIEIGTAFQIHDDIIGIESDTQLLGKPQGSDLFKEKPIYPVLVGMKKAKEYRNKLTQSAIEGLTCLKLDLKKLLGIFDFIISRTN